MLLGIFLNSKNSKIGINIIFVTGQNLITLMRKLYESSPFIGKKKMSSSMKED